MSEFPYYAHGALHELFVACQLTPGVVEVVLQADPYVAAEDKRVCGRWQLSRADRGDVEDAVGRERLDDNLQDLRGIGQRALEAEVAVQNDRTLQRNCDVPSRAYEFNRSVSPTSTDRSVKLCTAPERLGLR